MKSIKFLFLAAMTLLFASCDEKEWQRDDLASVPVYNLALVTPMDMENTTQQILYIDIYRTEGYALESTNLPTLSGLFYKYTMQNYLDDSTETTYDISYDIIYDEDINLSYSIEGSKSTKIVTLSVTKNADESYYNAEDVVISEVSKQL